MKAALIALAALTLCACKPDADLSAHVHPRGPVKAVPEPASWALLIIGAGAVGAALRARRTPAPQGS